MAVGMIILQWAGIVILVSLSALFAGLTLGLMSLDITGLEIVIASGTPKESAYARKIYPVRSRGNLLLCTLLLGNVSVNSLLSILMADFTSGLVGFLLSTTIIVILGEIVPQAACSRHGLSVGAHTVNILYFFLVLFFPFSYPISYCLDLALGREVGTIYSKNELKKLLDIHAFHQESGVSRKDAVILAGVLDFAQKKLEQVMTPLEKVFMLDIESRLDFATLSSITEHGHSRVPVYEREKNNIINCLHMKDLALVNPEECIPLRSFLSFYGRPIPRIKSDKTLDYVLTEFKSGKSHIAIVVRSNGANNTNEDNIGIATLEDVLEEILQDEIMDEDDVDDPMRSSREFRVFRGGLQTQLSQQQLKAIYTYLSTTLPEFAPNLITEETFKALIAKSEVKQIDKPSIKDEPLYQRSVVSPYFTLVLQGKVEIQSGVEGFRSEGGPFTYLGLNALKNDTFTPDFTAKTLVNAQLLRIKKKQYDDAIRLSQQAASGQGSKKGSGFVVSQLRPDPKNFMESTDFPDQGIRPRKKDHPRAKSPLNIAMRDFSKKPTASNREEKKGLIAAEGEEEIQEDPGELAQLAAGAAAVGSAFEGQNGQNSGVLPV